LNYGPSVYYASALASRPHLLPTISYCVLKCGSGRDSRTDLLDN